MAENKWVTVTVTVMIITPINGVRGPYLQVAASGPLCVGGESFKRLGCWRFELR